MGLLNDFATKGLSLVGASTKAGVKSPTPYGPDFSQLEIIEYIDGKARDIDRIVLAGRFMPHQPFEYGGTQKLIREDYPGASEPTVQVLGPRESAMTIHGTLKTNKLKDPGLRDAAKEYAKLIDAMRIRGNLVKITLGGGDDWHRWGFIEESKFRIKTLQEIEYDISFLIVGFNPPKGWRVIDGQGDDLIKPNKDITNKALAALLTSKNYPDSMPRDAVDILNGAINDMANALNLVTGFVDGLIADGNALVGSANRAIGLIKNARATISRASRQLGSLANSVTGLPGLAASEAQKTVATLTNVSHLHQVQRSYTDLAGFLASMQAQFAKLATTIPLVRHLVRQGDTLQTIAMKYYNSSDNWKKIYDHNKLTTTQLVVGSVLEVPKL